MSTESAFNKRLREETTMDQVEGLLEHFNLPPKTIIFIRKNQRIIQVFLAVVIVAVVAWSLYGSYMEKQREEAATALSLAMEKDADAQAAALSEIVEKYSRTSSSTWAEVELAHLDMKNNNFSSAIGKYAALVQKTESDNPLKPLVIYGLAQAYEGDKKYSEAETQYDLLKDFKGFESIGYISLGRLEETQGHIDKAIAVLNNFVLSAGDDPAFAQSRSEIENKIARLKAIQ
jgi:predicted negative regulator of RcsB-dependent stress response